MQSGAQRAPPSRADHKHRSVDTFRNRDQAADRLSDLDTQLGVEATGLRRDTAEQVAGLGDCRHMELALAAPDAARPRDDGDTGHVHEQQTHGQTIRKRSRVSDDRRCARGPPNPTDHTLSHLGRSDPGCRGPCPAAIRASPYVGRPEAPTPAHTGMGGSLHIARRGPVRSSDGPAPEGILMSVAPEPLRHKSTARRLAPDGRACPLRCGSCGYEIVNYRVLPPCPMCRKLCWEPAPWRTLTRSGSSGGR